jgi:polyadenylate-binding protein 2
MEQEAAKLKQMQAQVEQQLNSTQGYFIFILDPTSEQKEELDSRSVYIGNVDYSATPEELQVHFQSCGTINRVTILCDKTGHPKGYFIYNKICVCGISKS